MNACTDHRSATIDGMNPLPNGSNHGFGRSVRRPQSRGVGSPSAVATRARAYSRTASPTNSDATM